MEVIKEELEEPIKCFAQRSRRHGELVKAKKQWSWSGFALKFVPATICLWSLIMASGVVLGCFYGKIV